MLILLDGTNGQQTAVDVFDVASVFPATIKGQGDTPAIGVSVVELRSRGPQGGIAVKEGVASVTERINAARREAALLAAGREPAPDLSTPSVRL